MRVIAIIAFALLCAGCGRCVAERGVVDALDAGLSSVDPGALGLAGDDLERAVEATEIAAGAVALGDAAVEGCVALGDSEGWIAWARVALEAVAAVLAIIKGADVDVPDLLRIGVDAVQGLLPALAEGS